MTKEPEEYVYILRFSILKSKALKKNQTLKLKPLSFEFSVAVEKSKKTGDLIYWSHFKGLSISSYFTLWEGHFHCLIWSQKKLSCLTKWLKNICVSLKVSLEYSGPEPD